jgi:hypothetical protein
MSTDSPQEYLSLPAGEDENFSEIYDRRYAENPSREKTNKTGKVLADMLCFVYVTVTCEFS